MTWQNAVDPRVRSVLLNISTFKIQVQFSQTFQSAPFYRATARMEGSESEAVFDSLNVNPQLFINEVFNLVDDLVDDACNHFHQ